MKKILSVILSLSIMSVLTACSGDDTESKTSSEETTQTTAEIVSEAETQSQSELTFAQYLLDDFRTIIEADPALTTEQIAEELSKNEQILFSSMFMPVEEGFLQGFTQEITGFESGATFAPAMGSIAFVGYVFELSDEDTAKTFAETLKSCADPRWQICVEAEETVCEAVGNRVFFVMAPLSNQ
ncbi:MAG: hypothetical protein IJA12_01485 [Oscillospiraceae bacterium]|nr:hypothetical protein [Oscillospiraceae bacterium]